ncbi:hypothetical protein [Asaia spathodeae]|uniref:Uncharacterized protein n=1 Tax=Asaia spathodeae TaxID=657016 RepID=A0ABX2P821_9PROT|nr:hypothetical protein [Asaia spathodeae]GBR19761.1 hypothetical protein AA105894_2391 [Asaia spathodeae NBRC 105894]
MKSAISRREAEQFIALVKSGISQTKAAEKLGRSQTGMMDAARRLGVISERLPCRNDLCKVAPEEILAMHKSGMATADIATKVGLHPTTVSEKISKAKAKASVPASPTKPCEIAVGKPVKVSLREDVNPLEAGSNLSWSALGMDIDWKRAREMTAHLRPH